MPRPRPSPPQKPQLVVITGLSGSGKGTVLRCFEDLGYYAVDNLPVELISTFAELTKDSPNIARAALVVDVREGHALSRLPKIYRELRRKLNTRLLFLEADDATLVRRFSETRRPHPLGGDGSVSNNVKAERKRLAAIRPLADHVIDTTKFNVHELRDHIRETFASSHTERKIRLYINSFGFRHGVPADSDLVFDVRFLPNPNYIPAFKNLTGRHPSVARYIRAFTQTMEFVQRISDLLIYLLPHYIEEGKSYLTISFGCTGGHHRSVFIADEIRKRVNAAGFKATCQHRDITRPV
jgi:UPF0042 nucleotide-binding protein